MEVVIELPEQVGEQSAPVELSPDLLNKVGGGLADDFVMS